MSLAIRLVRLLILPFVVFLILALAVIGSILEVPFAVIWLVVVSLFYSHKESKRSWIVNFPTSLRGVGSELAFSATWAWHVETDYQRVEVELTGSGRNARVFFRLMAMALVVFIGALILKVTRNQELAAFFLVVGCLVVVVNVGKLWSNIQKLEDLRQEESKAEAEALRDAEAKALRDAEELRLAEYQRKVKEQREAEARREAEVRREAEARREAEDSPRPKNKAKLDQR